MCEHLHKCHSNVIIKKEKCIDSLIAINSLSLAAFPLFIALQERRPIRKGGDWENMEAIAGQSMFRIHKGMQGIHLRLCLTPCKKNNKTKQPNLPFDVGNLDLETVNVDLLHCLCASY